MPSSQRLIADIKDGALVGAILTIAFSLMFVGLEAPLGWPLVVYVGATASLFGDHLGNRGLTAKMLSATIRATTAATLAIATIYILN